MFDAISLYQLRWRKKKGTKFIIPAVVFYTNQGVLPPVLSDTASEISIKNKPAEAITLPLQKNTAENSTTKSSAFSISSIKLKKELLENGQKHTHHTKEEANDNFTVNEMLLFWNKYAVKLDNDGKKIISSILQMTDPKLENRTILIELPNQTTLSNFEVEKINLLGFLKRNLNNHFIDIQVIINEEVATKNAYTDDDKYERLKTINPNLEVLRKLFDLYY